MFAKLRFEKVRFEKMGFEKMGFEKMPGVCFACAPFGPKRAKPFVEEELL